MQLRRVGAARWRTPAALLLKAWAAALVPSLAWAACKVSSIEIPVRIVDKRPIATLVLNGTEVPMLVDSGAFYSFLSATTATQLKLRLQDLPWGMTIQGYTGEVEARRAVVDKVGLSSASLSDVEFIVGGNQLGAGIGGILGRNLLAFADTEYDLALGVVRLHLPAEACSKANMAYWAGEAPVVVVPLLRSEFRKDTPIQAEIAINGVKTVALFDTGAPATVLTLRTARWAGIKAEDMQPARRVGGAGAGFVSSWKAPVALFEVGGEMIRNSQLAVVDTTEREHGALVGLDYFLSHRIYVSRQQRQVYITWNGKPVFPPSDNATADLNTRYAALPEALPPDDAGALARRGASALAAGQLDRALEDLNRARELQPAVAEHHVVRARIHRQLKNAAAALADLNESLRLDPAHIEARLLRAQLQYALGDRAASLADLVQLDTQLPALAHQRADMAQLLLKLGQLADAMRQYTLWLDAHPLDARRAAMLHERCGVRLSTDQNVELALADCKESVELDAGEPNAQDSLGWVYLRTGDLRRALRAFDSSIKLKPSASSHFGRSVAHLRRGDQAASDAELVQARKLVPDIAQRLQAQGLSAVEGVDKRAAAPAPH